MNPDPEYYLEKVEEMLTVPGLRKNKFLISVRDFITENGFLTTNQAKTID